MSYLSKTLLAVWSTRAGRVALSCAAAFLVAGYGVLGFALLLMASTGDPGILLLLLVIWAGVAVGVALEIQERIWFHRVRRWIDTHFDAVIKPARAWRP